MITKVTITGADDSIVPAQLQILSHQYPFVEWGILCSASSMDSPRFPSREWLDTLTHFQQSLRTTGQAMNLSCHLCGRYVRELLRGYKFPIRELTSETWGIFNRVQLNTHGLPHIFHGYAFERLGAYYPEKQFIFQYDNANTDLFQCLIDTHDFNYAALFDLSHGAGVLPSQWPDLLSGVPCGYAGGLSPENLKAQIERIEQKAGDVEIWIDAETHVRTNERFDLDKVRAFLEIAKPYVKQ